MLLLVRGLPGSGKSTFVHQYYPDWFHVENDQFHLKGDIYKFDDNRQKDAIKWANETVKFALENKVDTIVSTCLITKHHIDYYVNLAEKYEHAWNVIWCNKSYGNQHQVPESVLESMKNNWQPYPGEQTIDEWIEWLKPKKKYLRSPI